MTSPGYDPAAYPPFAVTVDLVVLTLRGGVLHVLLVERGAQPWLGHWALPGGFVRPEESLDAAAARELAEETGVRDVPGHLEQLGSYGDPDRDPRMRVVSVAYLALAPDLPEPVAGTDAARAAWVPVADAQRRPLAFDHDRLLADGLERARAKLEYSPLAAAFCGPELTVADLRQVYEAVWGRALDPRNFHRKVTGVPGLLVETGRTRSEGRGRPATLYRLGDVRTLHPPITRD
ncbi:NUDIX hydrolase [Cellulomonas phragmiteti]|uniref:NUDIX hydrolase n=1 Tax=Cellulomonas phragmiteti TaxID=478780 RepID=A0ABQ4DPH9_9CELL|nr:NUDIX domain-containing protein [Cellulomonas phragmiteti]GIG41251.1 NUDIX hydrolase [Cellulomonas phragmiteti]